MAIDTTIRNFTVGDKRANVVTIQDQDDFVISNELMFDEMNDLTVTDINAVIGEMNTTQTEINTAQGLTETAKTEAEASAVEAEQSAQYALNAANYQGDWVAEFETTGYSRGMQVTYSDGLTYQSKVDTNLVEPTSRTNTAEWDYKEVSTFNYVSTSINYTAKANDFVKTSTALTITFPVPTVDGETIIVEKTDAVADILLTFDSDGTETFTFKETTDTTVITTLNLRYECVYDLANTTWRIG